MECRIGHVVMIMGYPVHEIYHLELVAFYPGYLLPVASGNYILRLEMVSSLVWYE